MTVFQTSVGREPLRERLAAAGCDLPEPGGPGEAEATRLWNGALHCRPDLVARCRTAPQVSAALRAAREAGSPVCVHNGGQDWNGRSLQDGALVLDISAMDEISIDAERREAVIGGGVASGRLLQAAAGHGLAPVIGNDGAVSMAGLMLGGGYGPLMTRFGLACDSLLSAEVVTPAGDVVRCDARSEPDLFWAVRGGGGGFGVLTSARVRLHETGPGLHAGAVVFPWPDAQRALARYGELMREAPAELFGAAVMAVGPSGAPMLVVSLVWTGDEAEGRGWVRKIASAGAPVVAKLEPATPSTVLSSTDGKLAPGLGYEVGTRWLGELTPDAVGTLVGAFEKRPSPQSSLIVHHCHGAATDVAAGDTAFGMRRPHFTALIYGAWIPGGEAPAACSWARETAAALDASALPGGYANLLADGDRRVRDAFGPNGRRLAEIKQRVDPSHRLHAQPVPGGGAEADGAG